MIATASTAASSERDALLARNRSVDRASTDKASDEKGGGSTPFAKSDVNAATASPSNSASFKVSSAGETPASTATATAAATAGKSNLALLILIVSWYITSIIAAKINYMALEMLGSSLVLSLFQQLFLTAVGALSLWSEERTLSSLPMAHRMRTVFPLAVSMLLLSISYNQAMNYIPVSFLNTIKSSIPLWTCLICWLVQGQKFRRMTRLSLVPIVFGVSMASLNEVNFSMVGFLLACFSALNQTVFNLRAKRILQRRRMNRNEVQMYTAAVCSLLLSVMYAASLLIREEPEDGTISEGAVRPYSITAILMICGINYYAEISLSYACIGFLGALAYSIADVVRRLIVIISAVILFGNPIGWLNVVGVCMAMAGIVAYNLSTSDFSLKVPKWTGQTKVEPPVRRKRVATNVHTI